MQAVHLLNLLNVLNITIDSGVLDVRFCYREKSDLKLSQIFYCFSIAIAFGVPILLPAAETPGETLAALAEMHFDAMYTRQGLPHDSIYGVTQDTAGFLWVATFGGLARFDGRRTYSWFHDPADSHSLPENNVRVLLPGDNGKLWVGTGNAGVVLYDPSTGSFEPLPGQPPQLSQARVYCLAKDNSGSAPGSIWFGIEQGLANYRPADRSWHLFGRLAAGHSSEGFPEEKIFSVLVDRSDNLWVGSEKGLYLRRRGTEFFRLVPGLPGPSEVGERPPVWTIFEDSEGRILIGTDATGAGQYDARTGRIRALPKLSGRDSIIGAHTVRGFVEVGPGELWIATYGGGLVTADLHSGLTRRWMRDPSSLSSLSNNFLRGIFRDNSGLIWLATDRGLCRTNPKARGILNIRAMLPGSPWGPEVQSLTASGGRIWMGFAQGGLAVIEPGGEIRRVAPAPGVAAQFASRREVLAIKPASDGTIFAGGLGLFVIDPRTLTYRPVSDPILSKQLIKALCVDGDTVWASTYEGLALYNRKTGNVRLYRHAAGDPSSLADNNARDILKSRDGRLWITSRLGLELFDPVSQTFRHFRHRRNDPASLACDNLQPMMEDSHGHIWLGSTGCGLTVLWDWPENGEPRFRTLDRKHGFPSDIVLAIAEGKDGQVWANTPQGLAEVDPRTFRIRNLTAADGLRTTAQNLFSSLALADGTILFPGDDGIIVIRPEKLRRWDFKAPLTVAEVRVPGSHVPPPALAEALRSGSFKLKASNRAFEAMFALLDFSDPESTRYSFKLEGFDRDWIETTAGQSVASYANLPPGRYTLMARATSRSGTGPEAMLKIPIEAPPLWYETIWFDCFKVGAVILLVIIVVRIRTGYLRAHRRELQRQVTLRTAELEEKSLALLAANEKLEMLATCDSLTGILNRRRFLELAMLELERNLRTGRPVSMIMADIDHFKPINDEHGHLTGDAVIREVATRLVEQARKIDLLSRYGGEEFVLLLPETGEEGGIAVAERLRDSICGAPVEYEGARITLTMSFGVAELKHGEDIHSLIDRADRAMYDAKRAGRNCVASGSRQMAQET